MPQGSPQFTPRQLLDAGRRAEADGKLDQANQLYRHLADHYAYTAEAAEARNGLGRIGIDAGRQLWAGNGAAPTPVWPDPVAGSSPYTSHTDARGQAVEVERLYRTGRALATLTSCVGWLIFVAGAAMVPLALAADPLTLQSGLPYAISLGPTGAMAAAAALSVAGLAAVFWGQMASALFDQANLTRELVAIERAKQGLGQD
jgi:hypothetical protein